MYKKSLAILMLLPSMLGFASCNFPVDQLGALYNVERLNSANESILESKPFSLWRSGNEVAQQYQHSNVTDIWNLLSDGRVRPVRHFDRYQRSIEYQPSEVNDGHGERDWSNKFQLLSDSLLNEMILQKTVGADCDIVETYTLQKDNISIELDWLPRKKLVKRYEEIQEGLITRYTLVELITDSNAVNKRFSQWHSYQSTDYADIGDDHSDPFLLEMVNLGFIEHAASGFYNSDGSEINHLH